MRGVLLMIGATLGLGALAPAVNAGTVGPEADLYVDAIGTLADRNEDDLFQINVTTGSIGPDTAEGTTWTIDGTNVVVDTVSIDVGSCTQPNAADVSCVIGENQAFHGRSAAVTYTVPNPGPASITSSISSSTFDPVTSNNSDTESFTVISTTPPDTDPPETTITGPTKTKKRTPAFSLQSDEPENATFKCRVDGKAFKSCESPFKPRLKPGKHKISAKATDAAGNVDPSPDTHRVTVKK